MLFCIKQKNFVQIWPPTAEIWHHINFSRWWPWTRSTTSGFLLVDATAFKGSKSISEWNFVNISQFVAEIVLLPFRKSKRPPYWNYTSCFDFGYITAVGVLFCIRLPIFIQIGPPTAVIWRHIDFSRWQPRPLTTTPDFVFVDITASEGQSLSANQIS